MQTMQIVNDAKTIGVATVSLTIAQGAVTGTVKWQFCKILFLC